LSCVAVTEVIREFASALVQRYRFTYYKIDKLNGGVRQISWNVYYRIWHSLPYPGRKVVRPYAVSASEEARVECGHVVPDAPTVDAMKEVRVNANRVSCPSLRTDP
jgi:hypothetical protein